MSDNARGKLNLKPKWDMKPSACSKCGGEVEFRGNGEYRCTVCGNIDLDDFGKVKKFLDANGPTPALVISDNTGVPLDRINMFLRQGRVEIPENSDIYIRCENCGTEIRFGRYCPACASKLSKQLNGVFEAGEVPKHKGSKDGKMRFLEKAGNDNRRK